MSTLTRALFVAAAVLCAPAVAPAADPPIVFQTQPVGKVLASVKTQLGWLPPGLATAPNKGPDVNALLAEAMDAKKSGLDLARPAVGYVVVSPDLEGSVVVAAVPVSDEKVFLGYVGRLTGMEPKAAGDGLYELAAGPDAAVRFRFHAKHAYFAVGKNPTAALDPKALIPADKLYDPAEKAQWAIRLFPDRLPAEVRQAAYDTAAAWIKDAERELNGPDVTPEQKKAGELMVRMLSRYLKQAAEVEVVIVRGDVNLQTGDSVTELVVVPKAGTSLAKDIGAMKDSPNPFAGILGPKTVVGVKVSLPLVNAETREIAVIGLTAARQQAGMGDLPPAAKPAVDAFFDGLIRTAKSGEAHAAGGLMGPNKDGTYTAVGAFSFDDPSALEKELRLLVEKAPPELKLAVKLDADKAAGVSIHLIDFSSVAGADADPTFVKVFGKEPKTAIAFAKNGIYFAFGSDAVAAVKEALAAKPPATTPDFEVVVNPGRVTKLAGVLGGPEVGANVGKALGTDDKAVSAVSLSMSGGKQLTVRFTVNVKLAYAGIGLFMLQVGEKLPDVKPVEDKK